ncbi:MAG: DUF4340 domain-containing protein [Candidatus Hydrothermales bacterium]
MIEKHLRFLSITFIILFILTAITESPFFKRGKLPKEIEVSSVFKEENIEKITLKRGEEKLELRKLNGIWVVMEDTHPRTADKERIIRLLENLSSLKGKVYGKSESEYPYYNVDDKNGTFLALFDKSDKKIFEIIVGKQGADFSTNFVRFPGKKEVLLVEKPIQSHMYSLHPSNWRNRKITEFKYEDAQRVEYNDKEQRFMLYKEGERWVIDSPDLNADQSKIQNYVRMLSSVFSLGYIDTLNIKEYDGKEPFLTILITLKNGEKQGFKVVEKIDKDRYLIKKENDNYTLYTLSTHFVEVSLKKERNWFLAEEVKRQN